MHGRFKQENKTTKGVFTMRPIQQYHDTTGKGDRVIQDLKDGEQLVSEKGTYQIKHGDESSNYYRGIDSKFDRLAVDLITIEEA